MKAVSRARVAPGGVLDFAACEPPLTVRQVQADQPGTCALCLVGTAAGPLDEDELTLCLDVLDGASATLHATGAQLAQGGTSATRIEARVGAGARLRARPGAVIVSAGSRVDVAVRVSLAADSSIDWREMVVLGRTDEGAGAAVLHWDVIRAGRAVLRQRVDLADPFLAGWTGTLGGRRVIATALLSSPAVTARTVVASPHAVAARLDEHTVLATVLSDSAADATRALDALLR